MLRAPCCEHRAEREQLRPRCTTRNVERREIGTEPGAPGSRSVQGSEPRVMSVQWREPRAERVLLRARCTAGHAERRVLGTERWVRAADQLKALSSGC